MKRLIKNLIVILAFIAIFIIIMFVRIGTVISTSMVPTLHVGQTIVYLNGNINGASKGDIIIYKDTSDANVIHRVVRVEYLLENNIIHRVLHVKGDNNLLEDNEPITENNYIGKAIYAIKSDAINSFIEHYNSLSFPARIALFAIFIAIILIIKYLITDYKLSHLPVIDKVTDDYVKPVRPKVIDKGFYQIIRPDWYHYDKNTGSWVKDDDDLDT